MLPSVTLMSYFAMCVFSRETNSMVEEFMLLANKSVAERIYRELSHCAILRRHPIPPVGNFDPLVRAAATRGFTVKVKTNNLILSLLL